MLSGQNSFTAAPGPRKVLVKTQLTAKASIYWTGFFWQPDITTAFQTHLFHWSCPSMPAGGASGVLVQVAGSWIAASVLHQGQLMPARLSFSAWTRVKMENQWAITFPRKWCCASCTTNAESLPHHAGPSQSRGKGDLQKRLVPVPSLS